MSCVYIYKNSKLSGKKCETKLCKKSKKYCSKHFYKESNPDKEKEITISDSLSKSNKEINIEDDIIEDEKGFLLIKGLYVINGIKSKVVIGKILDNKFTILESDDISFCIKNKLLFKQFI